MIPVFVKDKFNHQTLLKGTLSKWLYQLDLTQFLLKKATHDVSLVSVAPFKTSCNSAVSCTSSVLGSVVPSKLVSSSSICDVTVDNKSAKDSYQSALIAGMCKLSANILHQMFRHPNVNVLSSLCSSLHISFSAKNLSFCEACQIGKLHQKPHVSVETKTTKPFELMHSNLWGASHVPSRTGFKYYISFVDDFTRYSWIFPLHLKSEIASVVKHFVSMVKIQFGVTVSSFQSD